MASWSMRASLGTDKLLRGILNPRAPWEADTRDGRSVVESFNRWEKGHRPLSDSEWS